MAKNIVILGSSGFIGTNLVNHFAAQSKYKVFAHLHEVDSQNDRIENVTYVKGDLTNPTSVHYLLNNMDIVVNAAAVTSGSEDIVQRPYIHVTDNTIMNTLIFQTAYEVKVKHVIFLSCTVMYQPNENPQTEEDWDANEPIYKTYFGVGNMKVYSEKLCEFYATLPNSHTKFTALRHSNVYGPYDKFDSTKSHVLAAMISKVSNSKDSIAIWGTGKTKRDLIYIDDMVDAVDKSINNQKSQYNLFNIGCGKAYTIQTMINTIMKEIGKDNLELIYDTTKPDIPTTVIVNCDKAKKILGWECNTSLIEGIHKTITWYRKNK